MTAFRARCIDFIAITCICIGFVTSAFATAWLCVSFIALSWIDIDAVCWAAMRGGLCLSIMIGFCCAFLADRPE